MTTSWGATVQGSQGESYDFVGIYTVSNCLPVSIYMDNDYNNYQAQLFNYTMGIPDPTTFKPRKECLWNIKLNQQKNFILKKI